MDSRPVPAEDLHGARARFLAAAAVLAVFSCWALLPGLGTASFTSPDEYRALSSAKFHTPLFTFLYGLMLPAVGSGQPEAIFLTACLGLLVLALLVLSLALEGRPSLGILAALLLASQNSWVLAARSAYPCMLASALLLASQAALVRWERRRLRTWFWLASLLAAAAVSTYLPSYALVAGLGMAIGWRMRSWPERALTIAFWGASTLLLWLLITGGLTFAFRGDFDFAVAARELLQFSHITALFVEPGPGTILRTWQGFLRQEGVSGLALALSVAGLLAPGAGALGRFSRWTGWFSLCLYSGVAMAGWHTYFPRHIVLFLPFLMIGAAEALTMVPSRIRVAAVALLCVSSVPGILGVHAHTFSTEPIRRWCAAHGIAESRLATAVDLEQGKRTRQHADLPFKLEGYPFGRVLIDWKVVERRYRAGEIDYLLTSGIGTQAAIGLNDSRLARTRPLVVWPHPYRFAGHPFSTDSRRVKFADFAIYRLADVFG